MMAAREVRPGVSPFTSHAEDMSTTPSSRSAPATETQFRSLAENAAEPIITIDTEDHIVFANNAAARVFGYAVDELIRMPFTSLIPERYRMSHRAGLTRYVRSGERRVQWDGIELVGLSRDGTEVPLEVTFGEHVHEGRRYFTGIMRDISARRAAETERARLLERERAARADAQEANRAKSEFLATMSHEIRTPINAIIGYADLLVSEISGSLNDRQREHVTRIQASSRHLITLIGDILDLAKVEAGRMTVAQECHSVADTVTAALALMREMARRGDITLENECRASAPDAEYYGDPDRVRQILVNLLSNAIKFTEPGGRVTVSCSQGDAAECLAEAGIDARCTYIRVEDTGIGMRPEDLARVFRPFEQAQGGLTRERGGTGLGLTISRQLARLMDGDLTAVSTPGEGSSFTLWLPQSATRVAPPDETLLAARDDGAGAGMRGVGEQLQQEIEQLVATYVRRVQDDPTFPTEGVSRAEIEDHASTMLADMAQALVVLADSEERAEHLLRDGTRIQSIIAELHGAQRARLHWLESALNHEWDILWEELERVLHDRVHAAPDDVANALAALRRMIDYGRYISVRAWRQFEHPESA